MSDEEGTGVELITSDPAEGVESEDEALGVIVGRADDPEVGGRTTAADFVLDSTEEVERFLDTLAR